jgi:hypothetical protein
MKRLRVTALVALFVVCGMWAPTLRGDDGTPIPPRPAHSGSVIAFDSAAWLGEWVDRLARWLRPLTGEPGAVFDYLGGCVDPGGSPVACPTASDPLPESNGDLGGCVDPGGSPCTP